LKAKPRLTCLTGVLIALIVCLALAGATWLWWGSPAQPKETSRELFQGIIYQRKVRQSPRPLVIHVLTVNLRAPGIRFLVTPGSPKAEQPLAARTTSQFLSEFHLQAAINGDGFTPWRNNTLFDYYPHRGDPVTPIGLAASQGEIYSQPTDAEPTLYIGRDNRARFNNPIGGIYNAISGNVMLVEDGKANSLPAEQPQPRTAIGLDQRMRQLVIVVVDGRQPGYSEGVTLPEMAGLLVEFGAYNGMNLDGGGSSTLAVQGSNGKSQVLNRPIDLRIPNRERFIGNQLGIYADPVK
jgi:Phosphodiester glycosidase